MTLNIADKAALERLTDAIDALISAIEQLTEQLKSDSRPEMKNVRRLAALFEVSARKQRPRKKAP